MVMWRSRSGLRWCWWWTSTVVVTMMVMMGPSQVACSTVISSSVARASCRAACLHVFTTGGPERDARCRRNSDCFMCWNTCGILPHQHIGRTSMCSHHSACLAGCQVACRFSSQGGGDRPSPGPASPPRLPAHLPPPTLSGRGQVTWAPPDWSKGSDAPSDDVIYVLLVHGDGGWREVSQSSARRARVEDLAGGGINRGEEDDGMVRTRLLAVSQKGLVGVSEARLHLDPRNTNPPPHPLPYGHRVETVLPPEPTSSPSSPETRTTETTFDLPSNDPSHPHQSHNGRTETPYQASTQLLPLQQQQHTSSNPTPQATSVDPSWEVKVEGVEVGALAEVQVKWGERGAGEAEYLLSWAEQSGFVSGHLLTRSPETHLSLWPGQAYLLQVELVDPQGNAVLKSQATPVTFPSLPAQSLTPPPPPPRTTTTTTPPFYYTTTTTSMPSIVTRDEGFRHYNQQEAAILRNSSPLPSVKPWLDPELHDFLQDQAVSEEKEEPVDQTNFFPSRDYEQSEVIPNPKAEIAHNSLGAGERAGLGVTQEEQEEHERVYHVAVWCVGVGVGVLLLLTLCSMVVWLLNRCRKSGHSHQPQQPEAPERDYEQPRDDPLRESLRTYVAQQRNQTSSWTFENFCSVGRKSRMEGTPRRERVGVPVPVGIDNASLVENYVFMLDAPPPPSFIKR